MRMLTVAVALGVLLACAGESSAQNLQYEKTMKNQISNQNSAAGFTASRLQGQVVRSALPQYGFANVNRNLLSNAMPRPQKPFSGFNQGPSVSPYLALDSPFTSTASSYYNLVRPQLEQQRINDQMQQRSIAMQRQLNSVAAQGPYDPQGSENRAPTGHAAVYMNYGGYYAMPAPGGAGPGQQRR